MQVVVDLQEFDRPDEFETAVLEQLPSIGGFCAFGCELVFVREGMHCCTSGDVHKGEQFAILVGTVANEARFAS